MKNSQNNTPFSTVFLGVVVSVLFVATLGPGQALASMGSPPPPMCGKTLVLAKASPPVMVTTNGGTVTFPIVVYFDLLEYPAAGSGVCPAGPYSVDVSLDIDCSPGPDDSGISGPIAIVPGFNSILVPVTMQAGPVRTCTVTGIAATTLSDGMTLTAGGDTQVCVVEASAVNPNLPRLELRLSTEPIAATHPGGQAESLYRIINNDPDHSFSGEITVGMRNVSRMPDVTGPMPPGTGPYSVSDPVQGDHFPVGLEDDLMPAGRIYLPPDISDPTEPRRVADTGEIPPDSESQFSVYTRPSGQGADGSSSEGSVFLTGNFSNGDPAVACAGFVVAADTSEPPQSGGGQVTRFVRGPHPYTVRVEAPRMNWSNRVDEITIGEQPNVSFEVFSDTFSRERARTMYLLVPESPPLQPGEAFSLVGRIQITRPLPDEQTWDFFRIRPQAPTGFEQTAPGAIVTLAHETGDGPGAFLDMVYQVSGVAVGADDTRANLIIDTLEITPIEPRLAQISIQGTLPSSTAGGAGFEYLRVDFDHRGFARSASDSDEDGVVDELDNCVIQANADQIDPNGDGFGNLCDQDLDQSCFIDFFDLGIFKDVFLTNDPDADFDNSGFVDFLDLGFLKETFLATPGPSGLPNDCD